MSVLDASAILAWLQDEPGSDAVDGLLLRGAVSAVNWSEVLQKTGQHARDADEVSALLEALGLTIVDATQSDAEAAAHFWAAGAPLSLADRFCLALGLRLGKAVVTAEKAWADGDYGVDVRIIR